MKQLLSTRRILIIGSLVVSVLGLFALTAIAFPLADVWQIETVDSSLVANPSLAVDGAGLPHISYSSEGDLLHAWKHGSTWHFDTIEEHFSNTHVTALALDSNDHPHIGYHSPRDRAIKYAWFDGVIWHTEEVVGDVYFIGADEFSFGLDNTRRPHFIYNAMSSDKINYVYHDGSEWHHSTLFTLENGSRFLKLGLALDDAAHPHMCFDDPFAHDLIYAYHDGSTWQFDTIIDDPLSIPKGCSITVDGQNLPHISYQDRGLYYTRSDGSSWHFTEVDNGFSAGAQSSIALTDADEPRIAYTDAGGLEYGKLLYASLVNDTWHVETADILHDGYRPERFELAMDDAKQPHIGYWSNGPTSTLKYAKKESQADYPLYLPILLR